MTREVFWATVQEPGFEHLALSVDREGLRADGAVIGVIDTPPRPFRLHYTIACYADFRVRAVTVTLSHPTIRGVALHADGIGNWRDEAGMELTSLRGCVDVDIMTTPFTNTLPIRRLEWTAGRSQTLPVAYVTVPTLAVSMEHQRYTCLERSLGASRFRFESLATGFTAELQVDADGLVIEYSDIFRRVPLA